MPPRIIRISTSTSVDAGNRFVGFIVISSGLRFGWRPFGAGVYGIDQVFEEYVRSCGFWRAKARDIVASAQMLLSDFGGRVPDNMEDLLRLPGVGRKTANLILGDVYGQAGYVCDTHCIRITGLLGLTDGSKDPLKVEQQLRACIPPEESSNFCHRMVLHGRAVCVARRPDCAGCTLRDLCDFGKAQETV